MKFQNRSIHGSKVNRRTHRHTDRQTESNMPFQLFQSWGRKSWGHKNGVILSKFDRESPKVNQVIFFSAPTSIPNMKALAQIHFEISCTQDFQNLFSKGHYSNKGHNMYMKKI